MVAIAAVQMHQAALIARAAPTATKPAVATPVTTTATAAAATATSAIDDLAAWPIAAGR
jgi:hypothetical protein